MVPSIVQEPAAPPPHRRRHRHTYRRRRTPRVRMRFAWWQLWIVAVGILLGGGLVLALQPWHAPPPRITE